MARYFRHLFRTVVLLFCMISTQGLFAQSTSFFNYQAVISDPDGGPYEGSVGVKVTIIQGSETGEVVYSERHERESDEKGFIGFRVGEGDPVYTGELESIDWSAGPCFIRTELAPGGGFSYSISSMAELASVPIAMYARKADSIAADFQEQDPLFSASVASGITADDTARWNAHSEKATHQIGDLIEGGIVFYLEPDGKHGLVLSVSDIGPETTWGSTGQTIGAESSYDGKGNTEMIVNLAGPGDYAASYCDTLRLNGYEDWYLPSADEMHLVIRNRYLINKILDEDGNEQSSGLLAATYWTSSEMEESRACVYRNGNLGYMMKDLAAMVRAIRDF